MPTFSRRSILAAGLAAGAAEYATPAWASGTKLDGLAAGVEKRLTGFEGTVSLCARNLDSGVEFALRADDKVRTASTIKLPVLCALFDLVANGKFAWDQKLTLRAQEMVSGSGVLHELSDGVQLPLRDIAHLMIVVSDNNATNMILDLIGADAVNAYLERLGFQATRSMRKVRGDGNQLKPAEGWSKAGLLEENKKYGIGSTTPREMVRLLEMIEKGQIVSPAASKEIVAILKRQQYKDGIGRHRQDQVASKSGSLDALRSDVGLVYLAKARIAIAVTVDGMPKVDYGPDNVGDLLIADLSDRIVEALS
jgi:beta-lactamase class A